MLEGGTKDTRHNLCKVERVLQECDIDSGTFHKNLFQFMCMGQFISDCVYLFRDELSWAMLSLKFLWTFRELVTFAEVCNFPKEDEAMTPGASSPEKSSRKCSLRTTPLLVPHSSSGCCEPVPHYM